MIASKIYRSCLIPMAVTADFMGFGVYNMSHIVKTEYTVVSDKLTSDYRIVFLSDIHYDTIQDTALLGGVESTYGTYYVYGNHDQQRYVSQPAYTESELAERMQAAGMSA